MRLIDDSGEQFFGTTAEFTERGQGQQGGYSSSTNATNAGARQERLV
jgi:hypothetical protein